MERNKKVPLGADAKKYLQANKERGLGQGITISTWVGKYKGYNRWSWRVEGVISHQIFSNPKKAFMFTSVKGRSAYYPTSMLNGENKKKYITILALVKLDPTIDIHQLVNKMFGGK